MSHINLKNGTLAHMALSVLVVAALTFWLFSDLLASNYPETSVYENAELRSANVTGVRAADYAIKKSNNSFLIAPNAPQELRLSIEFMTVGDYSAVIDAQYPDWMCKKKDIDKAYVDIQGGSANERVKLISQQSETIFFSIAKGQKLTFKVHNVANSDCGRAVVTFYENNHNIYFKLGFCTFWALVFLLCLFSGASPYITVLGVFSNFLFIAADVSLGSASTNNLVVNTGLSTIIVASLFMFASLPKSRVATLIVLGGLAYLYALPLAFVAYSYVFSTPMSGEAIHGAMQSYDSQILEFWQQFVGKKRTLYVAFFLAALYFCVRHINIKRVKPQFSLTYSLLFLLVGVAVVIGRVHESSMTNLLVRSIIEYKWEIEAFKKVADRRKNVAAHAQRDSEYANDTTVVVIGESVNKKFMSSYGYVKNTTPFLDKRIKTGESVLYKNIYSNHSHSNPTMSFILTQANQYNNKTWLESPSVFNYAKAASVDTHWLTNHRLLGGWSNHITTIIREADRLKTINYKIGYGHESSNYDEGLVPLYKDAIARNPNQLTFLHLYNSHSFYCHRYPDGAKKFAPELPAAIYGRIGQIRKTSMSLLNCYVNTIHYTDVILEKLIQELELRSNPSALIYVTDHAEEPIDGRTHNSAKFTYDMVNIPLFVWANDAWRNKHPEKWKNLQDNKNKVFTNDLMFESILGISGIKSPAIDTSKDISSNDYQSLSNPLTLHGRVSINAPENWNYWQSQNGELANELGVEMIASNVESIGQAYAALEYGIRKLHVNAKYFKKNGVQLVSESDTQSIISLSDFLVAISKRGFSALVISLDTLDQESTDLALKEIAQLEVIWAIPIELASNNKPADFVSLSSLKFKALINGSFDKNRQLWVTFKSRYTHLPPTLEPQ